MATLNGRRKCGGRQAALGYKAILELAAGARRLRSTLGFASRRRGRDTPAQAAGEDTEGCVLHVEAGMAATSPRGLEMGIVFDFAVLTSAPLGYSFSSECEYQVSSWIIAGTILELKPKARD